MIFVEVYPLYYILMQVFGNNHLIRGRKDMGWDIDFPAIPLTGWDGMGRVLSVGRDIRGTLAWDGFSAGYPSGG